MISINNVVMDPNRKFVNVYELINWLKQLPDQTHFYIHGKTFCNKSGGVGIHLSFELETFGPHIITRGM
jgi:hypothetical protein